MKFDVREWIFFLALHHSENIAGCEFGILSWNIGGNTHEKLLSSSTNQNARFVELARWLYGWHVELRIKIFLAWW